MRKLIALSLHALLAFSTLDIAAHPNQSFSNNNYFAAAPAAQPVVTQNKPAFLDWCETYTDSVKRARDSSKPLLILFTGTGWCPACIKLEREVLQKPEFIQGVINDFVFYKAEFTDPSPEGLNSTPDSALLDRYNITAFPTIIVVDGNGTRLFSIDYKAGGPDAYVREIKQKLQYSKNSTPSTAQSFQQKRGN